MSHGDNAKGPEIAGDGLSAAGGGGIGVLTLAAGKQSVLTPVGTVLSSAGDKLSSAGGVLFSAECELLLAWGGF